MINAVPFEPDDALGWVERKAREAFSIDDKRGVRIFAAVARRESLVQLQSQLSAFSIFTMWWQSGSGSLMLYVQEMADARRQLEPACNVTTTPAQVRA